MNSVSATGSGRCRAGSESCYSCASDADLHVSPPHLLPRICRRIGQLNPDSERYISCIFKNTKCQADTVVNAFDPRFYSTVLVALHRRRTVHGTLTDASSHSPLVNPISIVSPLGLVMTSNIDSSLSQVLRASLSGLAGQFPRAQ